MANVTVIGGQWGDEGKGKIVDWLSSRADVVARFQGGHNAGHTLVVGEQVYKLSLLPSGIVRGTLSVIGNGVVLDPHALLAEIERLAGQGIAVTPDNLRVADNAALILSLHRDLDALREAAASPGAKIGTTGRGIGPAYEDKVGRRAIRLMDLADLETLPRKIERLLAHHNALRRGNGLDEIDAQTVYDGLAAVAPRVLPYMDRVWSLLDDKRREGKRILFEGAQGTLLDIDHGTYPFVTSSNPVAGAACVGAGVGPRDIDDVWGVAKAYATRVGAGPFPTELEGRLGDRLREAGGEFGTTTGRPRRCGWLDLVALRYAARLNGLTGLVITKLDVLTGIDPLQVAVRYSGPEGASFPEFPYHQSILHKVSADYEELPGWEEDIRPARRRGDLPQQAREYLSYIEDFVGVPIVLVGVGPGRDEIASTPDAAHLERAAA